MPDIFIRQEETVSDSPVETSSDTTSGDNTNHHIHSTKAKGHSTSLSDALYVDGHQSYSTLGSYFYYPRKVDFAHRQDKERIVLLVRKHPITNVPWILLAFIMIMAPAFVSILPFFEGMPSEFQLVFAIVWYMITMALVLEKFLTWFFNVNIITNERIIDVDFVNLFYRDISEAEVEQIQDVTAQVGGTIRTIFNYGDVRIQTAAEVPEIQFEAIPKPDVVASILHNLREAKEKEGRRQ